MNDDVLTQQPFQQLSPAITQLFTACMNNDIDTMKDLINNHQVSPYSHYYIDLDQQYNIPTTSHLSQRYTISLLDASILSNSPSMIDYVLKLLFQTDSTTTLATTNTMNDDPNNHHVELPLSKKIGFQPFALGLLTNKIKSLQHLSQHYNINPHHYPRKYFNCLQSILIQRKLDSKQHSMLFINNDIQVCDQNEMTQHLHQAVIDNNVGFFSVLVLLVNINSTNQNYDPPLYHAIINQQWEMAKLLIQHKAVFFSSTWSDESKRVVPHIIHYAIQDHNVPESFIDFLLQSTFIEQSDPDGYSPLLTAAKYGNIRILKHLVGNYNPNAHAISTNCRNIFHCAILSKDHCTIELLNTISLLNVDINAIDDGNNDFKRMATPLTYAIYGGSSFEIIKHVVELGADIITTNDLKYNQTGNDSSNNKVQSHLYKAIQLDDENKIFNYLFALCSNIPIISYKSLVQQAFVDANFKVVKLIIEKYRFKFDHDTLDIDLFQTIFNGFWGTTGLFQSPKFPIQVKMIEYVLGQNVKNCLKFEQNKYDFYSPTTPLLVLTAYPQTSLHLLQLMVQNGANVHDVIEYGDGVLQKLCGIDKDTTEDDIISKIDYCISLGVDVNYNIHPTTKKLIRTSLHVAASNKQFSSLVPHLIQQHNANITLFDHNNCVPLHYVNHETSIELLTSPSTINHQNNKGYTPLLFILTHPRSFPSVDIHYQILSKLIQCGADVNIPNNDEKYPIHLIFESTCFKHYSIDIIELLIKQDGIDLNAIAGDYEPTALELAVDRLSTPVGYSYISPAQLDASRPYHNQLRLVVIQSVKLLLQHGADITRQTEDGTILHYSYDLGGDYSNIDDDIIEHFFVTIMEGVIDQICLDESVIDSDEN